MCFVDQRKNVVKLDVNKRSTFSAVREILDWIFFIENERKNASRGCSAF
jgi:hypothetical protein